MKQFFIRIFYFFIKSLLRLRYKVEFKGVSNLTVEKLNKSGGTLFLPNHPSQLDAPILLMKIHNRFRPRPAAAEYLYEIPLVRQLILMSGALPVPSLDTSGNSLKRSRIKAVLEDLVERVRAGENLLFYPAGRMKLTGVEILGGASGTHRILTEVPEANIVLVRIKGLWGSSFSRALTGKVPSIPSLLWEGFKIILKNGIFFTPRRKVSVEFVPNPPDFPYGGSRQEINRYLENFYNETAQESMNGDRFKEGEPLKLVSFSRWKEEVPQVTAKSKSDDKIDIEQIPELVRKKVITEIARLSNKDPKDIDPHAHLAQDLTLDSLDATEILIFLEDNFNITGLPPVELTTVATVMAYASGLKEIPFDDATAKEIQEKASLWLDKSPRSKIAFAKGKTLQEAFLNSCERMGNSVACTDAIVGTLTYRQLKLRALLLAQHIQEYPGERIGILLPATVSANVVIFATLLAGKVPVMINWTVGPRHIEQVKKISGITHILTSWRFLDGLKNIEFGDIESSLVMLEDVRRKITLKMKLKALFHSKKSNKNILSTFALDKIDPLSPAAILFTSGTEALPKGVPLSHHNLIHNLASAVSTIGLDSKDVAFGILPPFHSFGFCVTGLMPILSGIKVAYSPDPTNSTTLARHIKRWGVTLVCSAPSFHKNLLNAATAEQLSSVRLFATGAEKTPKDLFEKIEALGTDAAIIEGYGITECSPVLTINRPGEKHCGVGRPLSSVEIKIVHPEEHTPLPIGERGLILAHGENVFEGYLGHNGPSPFLEMEGKRWYITGDLGYLNEEGYLTISGRLKRFVKIGAEMVSLGAIEEGLLEAAKANGWKLPEEGPPLALCALEREGEKPQLYLFVREPLDLEEANNALKEMGFSNLSRLYAIKQVKEIPLSGTGKVAHRHLQETLVEETKKTPNKI